MANRGVVRLSIDLIGPDEGRLHKALRHRAIEEGRPMRELVIEALTQYLEGPAPAPFKIEVPEPGENYE